MPETNKPKVAPIAAAITPISARVTATLIPAKSAKREPTQAMPVTDRHEVVEPRRINDLYE